MTRNYNSSLTTIVYITITKVEMKNYALHSSLPSFSSVHVSLCNQIQVSRFSTGLFLRAYCGRSKKDNSVNNITTYEKLSPSELFS